MGTLTGGSAVTVVAGVATFPGLSINKVGTGYTLTAASTPTYTAAASAAFNITPGAATQLAFVQGPSNTVAGATMTPAVTVAVEDANGNIETGDTGTTVSPGHRDEPGGGTLTGGAARRRLRRRRHLLRSLDQQVRHRLHADCLEHTVVHRCHLVGLQHHPGTPDHLAFVQGPTNSGRRLGHHSGGDRGGRGRQRQRRDR